MKHISALLLIGVAFAMLPLAGCGNAAPSQAPPITGKRPDWKTMTKAEKIELIKKQPMPEPARVEEIRRINAGED